MLVEGGNITKSRQLTDVTVTTPLVHAMTIMKYDHISFTHNFNEITEELVVQVGLLRD